jgi:hypothetical protein
MLREAADAALSNPSLVSVNHGEDHHCMNRFPAKANADRIHILKHAESSGELSDLYNFPSGGKQVLISS